MKHTNDYILHRRSIVAAQRDLIVSLARSHGYNVYVCIQRYSDGIFITFLLDKDLSKPPPRGAWVLYTVPDYDFYRFNPNYQYESKDDR